jgi:hypothetical protein
MTEAKSAKALDGNRAGTYTPSATTPTYFARGLQQLLDLR